MNLVDDAVAALLSAFRVGRGEKPDGAGWQGVPGASNFLTYVIFAPAPGVTDGPLNEADADVDRDYALQCVGATQASAGILATNVANAVRGQRITTATRTTTKPITVSRWGSVDPDTTVTPRVFVATHVIEVVTTPL